jgi:transposase-like protein
MKTRTIVAAAVTASLAAGAVGGALLFAPQLSGAQETSISASATPAAPDAADPGGPGPGRGGPGAELEVAATAIGISASDLRTAIGGGATIAQVAKDHGVDVQKVIDALVADARAKLQKVQDALPDRIAAMVNGTAPLGRPRGPGARGPRGPGGKGMAPALGAVAKALDMSEADLRAALQSGKSVADVAAEKGVDVQKVIDAAVAAASARIDQAVAAGNLDSAAAAKLKAALNERVSAFVHGHHPGAGPRGATSQGASFQS